LHEALDGFGKGFLPLDSAESEHNLCDPEVVERYEQ
jgi:hypothetical protein